MPRLLSLLLAALEMPRTNAEMQALARRYGNRRAVEVFWLDAYGGSLN